MNNYVIREGTDVKINNFDVYEQHSGQTSRLEMSNFRHAVSNHMCALC
jgi:hypothetical protein